MIGDDLVILCFFLAKKSKNLLLISVDFIQFTIGIKIAKKTIIIFAQHASVISLLQRYNFNYA